MYFTRVNGEPLERWAALSTDYPALLGPTAEPKLTWGPGESSRQAPQQQPKATRPKSTEPSLWERLSKSPRPVLMGIGIALAGLMKWWQAARSKAGRK
jgi:hypothetical protein